MVEGLYIMINISTINELIREMENSDTSLSTIRNLSALYNVRTHLLESNSKEVVNKTTKELSDILPSYIQYINAKRKYQLHEITDETVYINMKELCKEIKEFIQTLYSGTDTEKERELIKQMIKEMQ